MTEKEIKNYWLQFEMYKFISKYIEKHGVGCLRRPGKHLRAAFIKEWEAVPEEEKQKRFDRFYKFLIEFGEKQEPTQTE